jgi:hypothetical protein
VASQSRKHRGYASQRIVAQYLAGHGWPYAESAGAGRPGTDVTGVLDLDVEVKARRGFDPLAAMHQQVARGDSLRLPFAVLRMDGQGEASISEWPVVLRLDQFVGLLRAAGYGDSTTPGATDVI